MPNIASTPSSAPCLITALAPDAISSAGWNRSFTLPCNSSLISFKTLAAPSNIDA